MKVREYMVGIKVTLVFIAICFNPFSLLAQYDFDKWAVESVENDTICKVLEDDVYYDYFRSDFGKYEYIVDFSDSKFKAVLKVHKVSNSGFLDVLFKDTLIFRYQVKDLKVDGIGKSYDFNTRELKLQGTFRSNKTHGVLISFGACSEIRYVAEYRKGKFLRYFFHQDAPDEKALKKIEENGDPMEYKIIRM